MMDTPVPTVTFNREAIARTIETLIDLLDVIDGDPDLEPIDEREPEAHAFGGYGVDQRELSYLGTLRRLDV